VLGAPTGKRLSPALMVLVATLRRFDELKASDATAAAAGRDVTGHHRPSAGPGPGRDEPARA
jgi:hypothetical protein